MPGKKLSDSVRVLVREIHTYQRLLGRARNRNTVRQYRRAIVLRVEKMREVISWLY